MAFNYTKIKLGNWLYRYFFPLYNFSYSRFKLKNDAYEISLLKQLIKKGDHVLDIGANIGFYSRLLSRLTGPTGRVYCFEPDALNFRRLLRNTAGCSNVAVYNKAVSNENGMLKIYRSKLLNVDHRTYPINNYESVEEIAAVTIDSLIEQKTIDHVNLIKIDIQGYELAAFKGMNRLLDRAQELTILTEFWPHGFRRAGTSATEFFDFFASRGYTFSIIAENSIQPLHRSYVVENNDQPFDFSFNVLISRTQLSHNLASV